MWPVWAIQSLSAIDNSWVVVTERTKLAGKALASALSDEKLIGCRPVKLVGFGMGARVIFYALQELWHLGKFDTVSDCFLIGAPVSTTFSLKKYNVVLWQRARSVVAGRFVNAFSRSDWLLAYLYRYMEYGINVAGLRPLDPRYAPGVENIDISHLVKAHNEYPDAMPAILNFINFGGASEDPTRVSRSSSSSLENTLRVSRSDTVSEEEQPKVKVKLYKSGTEPVINVKSDPPIIPRSRSGNDLLDIS
jgi:hypothetical protein